MLERNKQESQKLPDLGLLSVFCLCCLKTTEEKSIGDKIGDNWSSFSIGRINLKDFVDEDMLMMCK